MKSDEGLTTRWQAKLEPLRNRASGVASLWSFKIHYLSFFFLFRHSSVVVPLGFKFKNKNSEEVAVYLVITFPSCLIFTSSVHAYQFEVRNWCCWTACFSSSPSFGFVFVFCYPLVVVRWLASMTGTTNNENGSGGERRRKRDPNRGFTVSVNRNVVNKNVDGLIAAVIIVALCVALLVALVVIYWLSPQDFLRSIFKVLLDYLLGQKSPYNGNKDDDTASNKWT